MIVGEILVCRQDFSKTKLQTNEAAEYLVLAKSNLQKMVELSFLRTTKNLVVRDKKRQSDNIRFQSFKLRQTKFLSVGHISRLYNTVSPTDLLIRTFVVNFVLVLSITGIPTPKILVIAKKKRIICVFCAVN